MLNVTEPNLANLDNYIHLLKKVWSSKVLSNSGPMLLEFQNNFCKKFAVKNFIPVCSGTEAIHLLVRYLLPRTGVVLTTPFSWVATASSVVWEGLDVRFCDVNEDTFNICIEAIKKKYSNDVVAVLATHTFGNPCDLRDLQNFCKEKKIKLLFDAAHAVGVTHNGRSLFMYGDGSALSFHATKIFNTAEGGGVVVRSRKDYEKISMGINFGMNSKKQIKVIGTNSKMSELHAALGIINMEEVSQNIKKRKGLYLRYLQNLGSINCIQFQKIPSEGYNYAYFPLVFRTASQRARVEKVLLRSKIIARRYFYPSLNKSLKIFNNQECPTSEKLAKTILVMPLHNSMTEFNVDEVCKLIKQSYE